ncbi:MAG TPA: hypothetical protein VFO86_10520, partial [Terriglobia bacterium]|nr:hypothetical protein [Terriglobia bacterium]
EMAIEGRFTDPWTPVQDQQSRIVRIDASEPELLWDPSDGDCLHGGNTSWDDPPLVIPKGSGVGTTVEDENSHQ